MVKIAIATNDGLVVNSHFGRAHEFHIVEVDESDDVWHQVEVRKLDPICGVGGHDDSALKNTIAKLQDCQVVLAERIGFGAQVALEQANIECYELPGAVDVAVAQLMRYRRVKALFA